MKALVLDRPGRPPSWRMADVPEPEPGPGELRVRVHAVGLNPVDYKLAASGHSQWTYPFVLGLDVAGMVDKVGQGVTAWRSGDHVYYHGNLARPGGFAELAVTTAHTVGPLPEGCSFAQAAALPCAAFTAYQAVHRKLHLSAGQTVLVQGGAGGVGGFAVQMAAGVGARVFTTCSAGNADHVRRLGAHEIIDYHDGDVARRISELTSGRGVDAVIDTLGAQSATEGLALLAFSGGMVCVAGLASLAAIKPFARALSVHEVSLGAAHESGDRQAQEDLARIARAVGDEVARGRLQPMLSRELPLEDVPRGLAELEQRHVRGKLVAVVS